MMQDTSQSAKAGQIKVIGNSGPMLAIIISDLRSIPVAAAFTLKRKFGAGAHMFMSSTLINHGDYGDRTWLQQGIYRRLKFHALKNLFGVKVIECDAICEDDELTGIKASVYSITNDSMASPEKYPELWQSMRDLSSGAVSLLRELKKRKVEKIVVFNGRLSSTYPIVRYAMDHNIQTFYYEYPNIIYLRKRPSSFTFTNFPIHRLSQWGIELLEFYKNCILSYPELYNMGANYKRVKLTNQFTRDYSATKTKKYDVVLFLSSPHEYKALDDKICQVKINDELDLLKEIRSKHGENLDYAVRCHPNQRIEPNWRLALSKIENYCSINKIDFFDPDSRVSSHELIRNSDKVIVDLSSIGIDAILMGKNVEILGAPDYKVVYEYANSYIRCSDMRAQFVAEVMSLSDILFQEPMSFLCSIYVYIHVVASRIKSMISRVFS